MVGHQRDLHSNDSSLNYDDVGQINRKSHRNFAGKYKLSGY
jgi:hypothetical protein